MRYWSRSMSHPPARVRQVVRESSPLASAFADQIPFQALPEGEEISPTEKSILDRLEQITSTPEIVPADETPGGIGSLDGIARLLADTAVTVEELERTRIDDHGNLGGRADDDHTQYHNNTRGDARYYTKSELMTLGKLDWQEYGRYLHYGNTRVFNPTSDYHPATKKYVDDNVLVEGEIDHTAILNIGTTSHADLDAHLADTSDPHGDQPSISTHLDCPRLVTTGSTMKVECAYNGLATIYLRNVYGGQRADVNMDGHLRLGTSPSIIQGDWNNTVLAFVDLDNADNWVQVNPAVQGSGPTITVEGDTDANIDLLLTPKGDGKLNFDGIKWPNADGDADQILKTDGAGILSWTDLGAPGAHKDSHDPEDGADPLDCAAPGTIQPEQANAEGTAHTFARSDHVHHTDTSTPVTIQPDATTLEGTNTSFSRSDHRHAIACDTPSELAGVQAAGEGSSTSFARNDHAHLIQHSIADNHLVTMDDANAEQYDYAKFTTDGLEGRNYSEVRSDLNVADGADVTGDNPPQAHDHDGDTLKLDGVNSDGGAFSFTTTDAVTFNQPVKVAEIENTGGGTYLRIDVQHSASSGVLITNDGAGSNAHLTVNGQVKGAHFVMGANHKLVDSENSELLTTPAADAAAVNNLHIAHAQTGLDPELSAVGDDVNIGLKITPKGNKQVTLDGQKWPASGTGATTDFLAYTASGDGHWISIDDLIVDWTPDGDADYLMTYDASAEAHRRVKLSHVAASGPPAAHKDSHDPEDGSDALDCAVVGDIGTSNTEGTAHSFARSDHQHKIPDKWRTRSFLVEVPAPKDDDEFIVHWFPHAATLTQVRVHVKAATSTTFDLTERGYDTPESGGTDISASPITATTTPTDVTMNNTGMAADSVLVYHSSAVVGTPGKVWIFGKYTVD